MRPPAPELERLVAAYLASRASADEVARLAEWLRTDTTARDYYLETADVHAGLRSMNPCGRSPPENPSCPCRNRNRFPAEKAGGPPAWQRRSWRVPPWEWSGE